MRVVMFATTFAFALIGVNCPGQLEKSLGDSVHVRGANMTDAQIVVGLREALDMCTTTAVRTAGMKNGFENNAVIKIPMPEKMQAEAKDLRLTGQGLRIDDFELSMNRAAEDATPATGPIFTKALSDLSFPTAREVLNGSGSAATDYFRRSSSAQLTKSVRPIVEAAMSKVDLLQQYDYLVVQIKGVTFGKPFQFDITAYLVDKILDGLLVSAALEERTLRANPQTQVSPLLREVFATH